MIISVANQKGGVGKTTTAQALFNGLVAKGLKVLAIDLDPQGNLSTALGAVTDEEINTIYQVMDGACAISLAIQELQGGDIIPSNILLSGAERDFISKMRREELLRLPLETIKSNYDFIIIDTPPALGILSVNAFVASDRIVIPMGADLFSFAGLAQLNDTIQAVKRFYSDLSIEGILLTKFNNRTNLSKELSALIDKASQALETKVFNAKIRASVSIQEAQNKQANLLEYSQNNAQLDYKEFIDEFLEGLNK